MKNKTWKKIACRSLICTVFLSVAVALSGCHSAPPVTREDLVTDMTGEAGGTGTQELADQEPRILVVEEDYLGGAELHLLACANGAQNLSCVIRTRGGSVATRCNG